MKKSSAKTEIPSCGCARCRCHRGPRCLCHDYNALLAIVLWDYTRMLRRHQAR